MAEIDERFRMMAEEKVLWVLNYRYNVLTKFPYKETRTQYRYADGGQNRILRKDDFRDGMYKDGFLQTYYGFDKKALLQRVIADKQTQIDKLENDIARMGTLLRKFKEEDGEVIE